VPVAEALGVKPKTLSVRVCRLRGRDATYRQPPRPGPCPQPAAKAGSLKGTTLAGLEALYRRRGNWRVVAEELGVKAKSLSAHLTHLRHRERGETQPRRRKPSAEGHGLDLSLRQLEELRRRHGDWRRVAEALKVNHHTLRLMVDRKRYGEHQARRGEPVKAPAIEAPARAGVTVWDAASYVLQKEFPLLPQRLQALLYYAQAWSLVWDNAPLFPDPVVAEEFGPVVQAVALRFRGRTVVCKRNMPEAADWRKLSPRQRDTVDFVMERYADYGPRQTAKLARSEGPWREARGRGEAEISHQAMRDFYGPIRDTELAAA
jgi:uncharacterized phage-associated protein